MANEPQTPQLIKPIPPQIVNEGANFGPIDLNLYIEGANRFQATLADGSPLTKGIICTSDGILSGIPASGTQGVYNLLITIENEEGSVLTTNIDLTIKERYNFTERSDELTSRKNKIWQSLLGGLELPSLEELSQLPITKEDIQYLIERYASFTVWDVFNLEPPSVKQIIELPGQSPHFNIYDCGSCLVSAPKELYSEHRTIEDAVQTARVVAREAVNRDWTVELAGTERVARAAWMEILQLGELSGKKIHVVSYQPSERDVELLNMIVETRKKEMEIGARPAS